MITVKGVRAGINPAHTMGGCLPLLWVRWLMSLPQEKLVSGYLLEVDSCSVIFLFFCLSGCIRWIDTRFLAVCYHSLNDESLQNTITVDLQSRERENLEMWKKEDESSFLAVSWSQNTVLMLSNNRDDRVKQLRWPSKTTEMIASERFSDQQNQQKFIVKKRFYWR